jgi:phosphatidylserine decarboxylase
MNAKMVIFAMREAFRLIDSVAYVGNPGDSEIVKADLLRAIQSIEGLKKTVEDLLLELAK